VSDVELIGKTFRLRQHVGYNAGYAAEDQQDRHAPLFAGQEATVVDVVPPGAHGAGPIDQLTYVLRFEHHQLGDHRDHEASQREGRHVGLDDPPRTPTGVPRHWSCTAEQLEQWFEPVADLDAGAWGLDTPAEGQ
jgi:hypothetical protein